MRGVCIWNAILTHPLSAIICGGHIDFYITRRRQIWFFPRSHSLDSGKQLQSRELRECCCCSHCKAFTPRLLVWWFGQSTHTLHCLSDRRGLVKVSSGRLRSPRDLEWLRSVLSTNALPVAVTSIDTQSLWLEWNNKDSSERTSPLTEEAMALVTQFTFPLFHGVQASVDILPKNTVLRPNRIQIDR